MQIVEAHDVDRPKDIELHSPILPHDFFRYNSKEKLSLASLQRIK
jgi:hypothetical protein